MMAFTPCKAARRPCTTFVHATAIFGCAPRMQVGVLYPQQAVGRPVDVRKHTDLHYFLDAAHGDEFNHQTMKNRDAVDAAERATRKTNLPETVPDVPDVNFEHTYVTVTSTQQINYVFCEEKCTR